MYTKEEMIEFAKFAKNYYTSKNVERAFTAWLEKRDKPNTMTITTD